MEPLQNILMSTVLISTGLFAMVFGLGMVKFASMEQKGSGMLTTVLGMMIIAIWSALSFETLCFQIVVWDVFFAVAGALLGGTLAVGIFLVVIMYS